MAIPWSEILQIVAYILMIIAKGESKESAISMASSKFGYSTDDIRQAVRGKI